jgi:hypothetical protein
MSKRKIAPERVYDPEEGGTHYVADGHSGNATLCGQTDWLCQKELGRPTDGLVDCTSCLAIVAFVESHNFKGTAKP